MRERSQLWQNCKKVTVFTHPRLFTFTHISVWGCTSVAISVGTSVLPLDMRSYNAAPSEPGTSRYFPHPISSPLNAARWLQTTQDIYFCLMKRYIFIALFGSWFFVLSERYRWPHILFRLRKSGRMSGVLSKGKMVPPFIFIHVTVRQKCIGSPHTT